MPKPHPTIKKREIEFQTVECKVTFPTGVRGHANTLYMQLPPKIADYYNIKVNDTLLVSIHELRRARETNEK